MTRACYVAAVERYCYCDDGAAGDGGDYNVSAASYTWPKWGLPASYSRYPELALPTFHKCGVLVGRLGLLQS